MKDGTTDEVIAENVTQLCSEGLARDLAVMQAYKHAGRSNMEASLAAVAVEAQDPAHAIAQPTNGFRAAAERPFGRIAR